MQILRVERGGRDFSMMQRRVAGVDGEKKNRQNNKTLHSAAPRRLQEAETGEIDVERIRNKCLSMSSRRLQLHRGREGGCAGPQGFRV